MTIRGNQPSTYPKNSSLPSRTRSVDPFRADERRERLALLFDKGFKSPLACNETIIIRHDVVQVLFPGLPSDLRGSPYLASEEVLIAAGLGPYLKRCLTVTGGGCRTSQLEAVSWQVAFLRR